MRWLAGGPHAPPAKHEGGSAKALLRWLTRLPGCASAHVMGVCLEKKQLAGGARARAHTRAQVHVLRVYARARAVGAAPFLSVVLSVQRASKQAKRKCFFVLLRACPVLENLLVFFYQL